MNGTDDRYREWDAAYVAGALSPDERREYERHLADCAACRVAVAELAGLPGILGLLTAEEALVAVGGGPDTGQPGGGHQPTPVQGLARRIRSERRTTRVRAIAGIVAGAAVLLVVGVILGSALISPGAGEASPPLPSPTQTGGVGSDQFEMAPLGTGAVSATLNVAQKKWGTLLTWECRYDTTAWGNNDGAELPRYALWVTEADGTESVVASWQAAGDRAGGLAAATSIPTDDIRTIEIRTIPGEQAVARTVL